MTTPTPQFNGQSDPQYTNQEQAYAQQGQPYGQPTFAPSGPAGYQQKSKIIAGILGIFLGGFGIHNFYLGRTTRAVIQLVRRSSPSVLLRCGASLKASSFWCPLRVASGTATATALSSPTKFLRLCRTCSPNTPHRSGMALSTQGGSSFKGPTQSLRVGVFKVATHWQAHGKTRC